jgi:hypothetical protein
MKEISSPNLFLQSHDSDDITRILNKLPQDTVKFTEWQKEEVPYKGTVIKKMRLHTVELPKTDFVEVVSKEFQMLREHVRRVNVQYRQISILRQNLVPGSEVTCHMDYAENYSCGYQDEPSNLYYDRSQVTVHPMIVHYRNQDGHILHQSFVGISSEKSHAAPTTLAFIKKIIPEIQKLLPNVTLVHYVTDSPPTQYRNKSIVKLVASHAELFSGITATWDYMEAGHGKGPCDGVGGSVKRSADIAVKSGETITSASDFYLWATRTKKNISFLFVTPEEVKSAEKNLKNATFVKGVSNIHSLRPHQGFIFMRDTSCYECCRQEPTCAGWQQTTIPVLPTDEGGNPDGNEAEEVDVPVMSPSTSDADAVQDLHPPTAPDNEPDMEYQVGNMVQARYLRKVYVGKVVEVSSENREYYVRFMKKRPNGSYFWPKTDDELWVEELNVLNPVVLNSDGVISKPSELETEQIPPQTKSTDVQYKIGSMVDATYMQKQYVAKVIEYDNEYFLSFMVKQRNGRYVWPKRKDELWVLPSQIIGYAKM